MQQFRIGFRAACITLCIALLSTTNATRASVPQAATTPTTLQASSSLGHKLGLGEHSIHPKRWSGIDRNAINILPQGILEQIRSMLPGNRGDELWFSTGPTLQHIDGTLHVSLINMPNLYWQVGALAHGAGDDVWFTLDNASRIGVLHDGRIVTYPFGSHGATFPDGVAVAPDSNVWVTDNGNGEIDRFKNGAIQARHAVSESNTGSPADPEWCGGRIWFAENGGRIGYLDGAHVRKIDVRPNPDWRYASVSLACGVGGRLWYRVGVRDRFPHPYNGTVGYIDPGLQRRSVKIKEHLDAIACDRDGTAIAVENDVPFAFYRVWPSGRIERRTLPLSLDNSGGTIQLATGPAGTIWLSLDVPPTIVKLIRS